MPTVFVISQDWTLRAAVRAELRQAGIEALGMDSWDDVATAIAQGTMPSLLVADETGPTPLPAALATFARRMPVVLVGSRTLAAPSIEAVAAVLPRPVRVGEITAEVVRILKGQAA